MNIDPSWLFVENEGALYRGATLPFPQAVWSFNQGQWLEYADKGRLKPEGWGQIISEAEAMELIACHAAQRGDETKAEHWRLMAASSRERNG